MFGGTTDYKTPVGIGLYYNRDWYPLSREQGEIFASALAAGKLISTADEAVIDYPKKNSCLCFFWMDKKCAVFS